VSDVKPETTATGQQLANIFGGQNDCNLLFHQATKCSWRFQSDFENFKGVCGPE